MKKLLLTLAAVAAFTAQAQQFEVVSTQQLSVGAEDVFHPVFTPDGNSLLVSSAGYDGLGIIDIASQSYTKVTDMRGAGWMPAISEDGKTVVVRNLDNQSQGLSLYSIDLNSLSRNVVASNVEHINRVNFVNGVLSYGVGGSVATKKVTAPISAVEMPNNVFAFIVPNSRISKYDLFIRNTPCTIDADYRGEWKIRFGKIHTPTKFEVVLNKVRNWMGIKDVDATVMCSGQDYKIFQVGDVVGQAIFLRYDNVNIEEVTELSDTVRGEGGFGSTEKLVAEPAPAPAIVVEQPTEPKPKRKRKKNA